MYVYVCVRMFVTCVYMCLVLQTKNNRNPDMQKGVFLAKCICHKPSLRSRVTTALHATSAWRIVHAIASPHLTYSHYKKSPTSHHTHITSRIHAFDICRLQYKQQLVAFHTFRLQSKPKLLFVLFMFFYNLSRIC